MPQGIQRHENQNSADVAETSKQTRKGNIMKTTLLSIQRFLRDEDGIVAIEYGLMAVLIALFTNIADCFGSGSGTCPVTLPAPL